MNSNWYKDAMASFGKGPALPGDVHECFDNAANHVLKLYATPGKAGWRPLDVRYRESIEVECPLCDHWIASAGWSGIESGAQVICPVCSVNFTVGNLVPA